MTRQSIDFCRRNFFLRCCQMAPAGLIPPSLWKATFLPRFMARNGNAELLPADYRLTPNYREHAPLDSVLPKTQAGNDAFVREKYEEQMEAVLAKWTRSLKQSSGKFQALEDTLAPTFLASPVRPTNVHCLRSGPGIEIFRSQFSDSPPIGREQFIRDFTTLISPLPAVLTPEFQGKGIQLHPQPSPPPPPPPPLQTTVIHPFV